MANDYDVLIIGGGLAGLTASIYSARYGMSTGVIELMMGGASIINLLTECQRQSQLFG